MEKKIIDSKYVINAAGGNSPSVPVNLGLVG
jgi:hypothetical protein